MTEPRESLAALVARLRVIQHASEIDEDELERLLDAVEAAQEVADQLVIVLPMARGYARCHVMGRNNEMVEGAQRVSDKWDTIASEGQPQGDGK